MERGGERESARAHTRVVGNKEKEGERERERARARVVLYYRFVFTNLDSERLNPNCGPLSSRFASLACPFTSLPASTLVSLSVPDLGVGLCVRERERKKK